MSFIDCYSEKCFVIHYQKLNINVSCLFYFLSSSFSQLLVLPVMMMVLRTRAEIFRTFSCTFWGVLLEIF